MSNIFVTNRSDKKLKDGYAGVFYSFPKDETVEIPWRSSSSHFWLWRWQQRALFGKVRVDSFSKWLGKRHGAFIPVGDFYPTPKQEPIVIPVGGKSTPPNL